MALATVLLLCFAASWWFVRWILRRAVRWRMVQAPNHRSSHDHPTAQGGGLGIVLASTLVGMGLLLVDGIDSLPLLAVLMPGFALAVTGLVDDHQPLPAWLRLVVQVGAIAGALLAVGTLPRVEVAPGFRLDGLWLEGALVLAGVWWVNLFNFMDGIDGIAGGQASFMLIAAVALALWGSPQASHDPLIAFALCVAAATLGFLAHNWAPARIFMGDVGSTWLAFAIFVIAVLTIQRDWLGYATWVALAAVFVTDATVTLAVRMLHREAWYRAHRSHAYQRLARGWPADRTSAHRAVTLWVLGLDCAWVAPLAAACLIWPRWTPLWLTIVYAPLVVLALRFGAGRSDHA